MEGGALRRRGLTEHVSRNGLAELAPPRFPATPFAGMTE
jgi:hypothetical protein